MKMGKLLLILGMASLAAACAGIQTAQQADRQDILYTCDCGPQCTCNSMGTEPGNCSCGRPMKWGHVLKVEGNEALLCQCAEGCRCSIDPKDPSRCGCGQPVKRVSMAGTGIYFCNCGGSCFCNTVSSEPGRCKCGMNLKKVN